MAGKRRHLPAQGESPISDTFEIHDSEQEQTIRLDASRWAGFRDVFGEREFGVDEHGRSIELLRLTSPFTPFETALKARVGRLASFDNAGVGRAFGIDHDDRTGRLVLVSERVAGVRLSELLDRAFGRSLLPDLAAALFVIRRLLAIAESLHRETGIAHLALAPERIVVTPRSGVVLVELPLAGAIEGLARVEGGFPPELRLSAASADVLSGDPRLDIARIATVGVSMLLGRTFEPDETIDPLSPVLQEVEEVAAIRADQRYGFALRQWFDRAVTVDPALSFPTFRDAHHALDSAQPPADCVRLRPALARFVQALALESVSSAEAVATELERLRAVRVRQAAARVERPARVPTVSVAARPTDLVGDAETQKMAASPKTDGEFWRRAVAARFQMVRQPRADTEVEPEAPTPLEREAASPIEEPLRLVPPPATASSGLLADDSPAVPLPPIPTVDVEPRMLDEVFERLAEGPTREAFADAVVHAPAIEPLVERPVEELIVERPSVDSVDGPVVDATLSQDGAYAAEAFEARGREAVYVEKPPELRIADRVLSVQEPAPSEESRLAWIRAVTQQLEAARSAERAGADGQYDAPPVEFVPPRAAPENAPPVEPITVLDEAAADSQAVSDASATASALPMPTSRLAEEPTLAELHNLLTSVDEDDDEKSGKGKGSWLQAVKARLGFGRRSTDAELEIDEPPPPIPPIADPEPQPIAEVRSSSIEPAATPKAATIVDTPVPAEVAEDAVRHEIVEDRDDEPVRELLSSLEGLRTREPSNPAWTAAVTSALAGPEPKPVQGRDVPLPPPLEVVHPAASVDSPKKPLSTPVPRPSPAQPLPDFEEEPRRGVQRWAIWAGLAVAVVGGGAYLYSSRSQTPPAEVEEAAPETAPVAAAAVGSLSITSDPPGATVTLDGTERGVTPLKLAEVAAGNHRLQLRGEGGVVNRTIGVKAGEEARVDEAIFSGWIAVFAPFELQIFADGKQIGTTGGSRIMLPAGPHDLQLVNARLGYRQTHKIEVRPGEVSPLNIAAPEGLVQVNGPDDAELFVDGQRAEKGSGQLRVPIGTREVLVRHAQGEHKVLVTVTLSEPAVVTVPIRP
jgi:hypothetical protein